MAAPLQKAAQTKSIARAAGTVAASLVLALPTTSFAAICDYAPTSDLCAQERQREALKPKAKGDKGKGPAMAIAKPVAKPPAPPAPKRGLDDHDSEVARALLRGKHGVGDDPHRTVSPTDVTADVYAAA